MPHPIHYYVSVGYLDVDYGAVSYWSRETNDFDINSEIVITPTLVRNTPFDMELIYTKQSRLLYPPLKTLVPYKKGG